MIAAIIHLSYNQEHRFDQQNLSIFRNDEEEMEEHMELNCIRSLYLKFEIW